MNNGTPTVNGNGTAKHTTKSTKDTAPATPAASSLNSILSKSQIEPAEAMNSREALLDIADDLILIAAALEALKDRPDSDGSELAAIRQLKAHNARLYDIYNGDFNTAVDDNGPDTDDDATEPETPPAPPAAVPPVATTPSAASKPSDEEPAPSLYDHAHNLWNALAVVKAIRRACLLEELVGGTEEEHITTFEVQQALKPLETLLDSTASDLSEMDWNAR